MKTRTLALTTILAALLALAGCAQTNLPAAHAASAPYPMLGFASPAAETAAATDGSPRFEDDRILPKPVVMTDKWAR